jgi:hypothetical protein
MSVRLSAYISAAPSVRIVMKFHVADFLLKSVQKTKNLVKIGQNALDFTLKPKYFYIVYGRSVHFVA